MIAENSLPAAGCASVADQESVSGSTTCAKNPSFIPGEDLAQSSRCISVQHGRAFAGKTKYESAEKANAALAQAKQVLPQVKSAYQPSGSTTVSAALLMIAATPIVLIVLLGVCGGLCVGWSALRSNFASTDVSVGMSRLFGLVSLGLDLLLVVLMVVIPMACYGMLSKAFKNRNPILPAVLAGTVELLVAIALFVPIWKGETLAPTHLTFMLIPVRWILIVIGGVLVPFIGAIVVAGKVSEQKFCERTGLYLRRYSEVQIPFDYAENALTLLSGGNFAIVTRLPQSADKSNALITLWWEQGAATAFLEMEMRFRVQYQQSGKTHVKADQWRAFSRQLEGPQAEQIGREWNTDSGFHAQP